MNNTISVPRNPKLTVRQLALTGLMSAVICILGPWSFQLPVSPVPISLGFLAIYFVVSVMGMKLGTLSVIIYILLGAWQGFLYSRASQEVPASSSAPQADTSSAIFSWL